MGLHEPEKKDHSTIFQTFAEYKRCLLSGEDPATVGNGSYQAKEDNLCKTIRNCWGEDIKVFVPTTQEQAEGEVEKIHGVLRHLGVKSMLVAMKTQVSILFLKKSSKQSYEPATSVNLLSTNLFLCSLYTLSHM